MFLQVKMVHVSHVNFSPSRVRKARWHLFVLLLHWFYGYRLFLMGMCSSHRFSMITYNFNIKAGDNYHNLIIWVWWHIFGVCQPQQQKIIYYLLPDPALLNNIVYFFFRHLDPGLFRHLGLLWNCCFHWRKLYNKLKYFYLCTWWDSFWIVYSVTLVSVWDHCLTPSCTRDPTFWLNTFSLE